MDKRQKRRDWEARHAKSVWRHRLKRQERNKNRPVDRLGAGPNRRPRTPWPQPVYESTFANQPPEILKVGAVFSLLHAPEYTVEFLSRVASKLGQMKHVRLELSKVTQITIDTLLYLLASIDKYKQLEYPVHVSGNYPTDPKANRIFKESGFFKFTSRGATSALSKSADTVQIREGMMADSAVAKELCLFAQDRLQLHRTQTKFLYDIALEIISNTRQHAYKDKNSVVAKWYSYATYNKDQKEVVFSILDTGDGIPATVKKDLGETVAALAQKIGFQPESARDEWLITSALNGDFRTKTGEKYRGKGLPMIMSYYKDGSVFDLTVISNRGFVSLKENHRIEMAQPLKGTLYSWRLRRAD